MGSEVVSEAGIAGVRVGIGNGGVVAKPLAGVR